VQGGGGGSNILYIKLLFDVRDLEELFIVGDSIHTHL